MKKEPLKDKRIYVIEGLRRIGVFPEIEVKYAVEWLKEVIKATSNDMPTKLLKECLIRDDGAIDQAFEDVK